MAYNPDSVWISPSTISDFEKCAQLYYLRSVYRNPVTGLKIQLLNSSLALGQVVHDSIEQFVSLAPTDRQDSRMTEIFDKTWQNVCKDAAIFKNEEEMSQFRERGEEMLDRFLKNEHFKNAIRSEFPDFPKADLGDDIMLTGKLDWIEKSGDGFAITDFKTGKNEERDDSIQLPIYAFLAEKILKTNKLSVNYWYLDKSDEPVELTLPNMDEFAVKIKQTGMRMKMAKATKSFACSKGGESCWACKDMLQIAQGKGKLIAVDAVNRKQETYILITPVESDLPF